MSMSGNVESVCDGEVESEVFDVAGVVLEFDLDVVSICIIQKWSSRDIPSLGKDLRRSREGH